MYGVIHVVGEVVFGGINSNVTRQYRFFLHSPNVAEPSDNAITHLRKPFLEYKPECNKRCDI
jgi:hypothetical protein